MKAHNVEPIKRLVENATGLGVPTREEALATVRDVKPLCMKFRDDGYIPNNSRLPLLYYRKVFRFDRKHDPAATLEVVFNAHSWGEAWRNGIYDFVHYHSMIHEVLGVARAGQGKRKSDAVRRVEQRDWHQRVGQALGKAGPHVCVLPVHGRQILPFPAFLWSSRDARRWHESVWLPPLDLHQGSHTNRHQAIRTETAMCIARFAPTFGTVNNHCAAALFPFRGAHSTGSCKPCEQLVAAPRNPRPVVEIG